jgi:hypothetical protein
LKWSQAKLFARVLILSGWLPPGWRTAWRTSIRNGWLYTGDVGKMDQVCKERMAAYKYPRQIEIVSEIPKTLTGKFLRRTLREKERGDKRTEHEN